MGTTVEMTLDMGAVGKHKNEGKSMGEPALPLVCWMMMMVVVVSVRESPSLPFVLTMGSRQYSWSW